MRKKIKKTLPRPLCGWIILDKPSGLSSMQAVTKVKEIICGKKSKIKIGHGGTLDPLATGILPIAIGEYTKAINYINDRD